MKTAEANNSQQTGKIEIESALRECWFDSREENLSFDKWMCRPIAKDIVDRIKREAVKEFVRELKKFSNRPINWVKWNDILVVAKLEEKDLK